jgi:hypothetical protein
LIHAPFHHNSIERLPQEIRDRLAHRQFAEKLAPSFTTISHDIRFRVMDCDELKLIWMGSNLSGHARRMDMPHAKHAKSERHRESLNGRGKINTESTEDTEKNTEKRTARGVL